MSQMPTPDMSPATYIHVHLIRIRANKDAPKVLTHPTEYDKYHLCIASSLYFLLKYTSILKQSLLEIEENMFIDKEIYDDINKTIDTVYSQHNSSFNQIAVCSQQNILFKKRTETEFEVIKSILSKYKGYDVSVTNIQNITMLQNHIAGGGAGMIIFYLICSNSNIVSHAISLCKHSNNSMLIFDDNFGIIGIQCVELETAFRNLTQCYRFLSHPPPSFYAITL